MAMTREETWQRLVVLGAAEGPMPEDPWHLCEVDLREANLRGADLIAANLRKADLRKADLRDTELSSADLSNADLKRTRPLFSRKSRKYPAPVPMLRSRSRLDSMSAS